jgi:thimet oligopeptidase
LLGALALEVVVGVLGYDADSILPPPAKDSTTNSHRARIAKNESADKLRDMRFFLIPALLITACTPPLLLKDAENTGLYRGPSVCVPPSGAKVSQPELPMDFSGFQALARTQGLLLELPHYEQTPEEIGHAVEHILGSTNADLDAYAAQNPQYVTFESAIAALDHITYPASVLTSRLWLMKETQQDEAMRSACTEAVQKLSEWGVEVSYRTDIYEVCQAFEAAYESGERAVLQGEDKKFYEETMRDYRRDGMALSSEIRTQVAGLKNELNRLATEFDTNITNAQVSLSLTADELTGVSDDFLAASKQEDGTYRARATTTPDYMMVMQNCSVSETRRRMNQARYSTAMDTNGPILNQMVAVREKIATLLGYANWADYKIEPKMAQTGAAAVTFAEDLATRLQPKFDAEVAALREYKVKETGVTSTTVNWWDFRYYQNILMKDRYGVDTDALRNYFPLNGVLVGMFRVYETIFNLKFTPVDPGYKWVDDLRLYVVTDAGTQKVMGAFYLDLFPREGKYNHFAQFDIIGGKQLTTGQYQRPVVSLVCNFTPGILSTPAKPGKPALMDHGEVETIFHEFGHAMHSILTEATYSRYSGANVERDFVEAPSQMFEAWAWDPTVLADFAKDWRDETETLPLETIAAMKEANLATRGIFYRRQLGLALADLRMHLGGVTDAGKVCNDTNSELLFPVPENTNFAAYWGHLTGYDAGYYGYAWADSLAADMVTVFENAPQGFLDQEAGMRLRREVYQVGGARTGGQSVRAFLTREPTNAAFVKTLGLK